MKNFLCAIMVLFAHNAFAANPVPEAKSNGVVDAMKAQYYQQFSQLPPSHRCVPNDVHGDWKEVALFEFPVGDNTQANKEHGNGFLVFDPDYSRFVSTRSKMDITNKNMRSMELSTPMQYISTAKGLIYIYNNSTLISTLLCFVVDAPKENFKPGQILIAAPTDAGKGLSITAYSKYQANGNP